MSDVSLDSSLETMVVWWIRPATRCQRGASAVEYAILVGFIAAVIVTGVALFGTNVSELFDIDITP